MNKWLKRRQDMKRYVGQSDRKVHVIDCTTKEGMAYFAEILKQMRKRKKK